MRPLSCTLVSCLGLSIALSGCDKQADAPKPEPTATGAGAKPETRAEPPPDPKPEPKPETKPEPEPVAPPSPLGDLAIEWVAFEGGDYNMVMDNEAKTEYPVQVGAFEISKTEVTNAQYAKCVEAGACTKVNFRDCTDSQKQTAKLSGPKQPVFCVDWAQALAFSEWVGGALPTEAQWTFAYSNGGKAHPYPWGDAKPTCELAVMNWGCRSDASMDVCSKPAGNSKSGLCDMAGNVSELMGDVAGWDGDTAKRGTKINRGGSWHGIDPLYYKNSPKGESMLRVEHRSRYGRRMRDNAMGFRPVRVKPGAAVPVEPSQAQKAG